MSARRPAAAYDAEPGRVLVIGSDAGWREYTAIPPGYGGKVVLPNGPLPDGSEDRGTRNGVRVWSVPVGEP